MAALSPEKKMSDADTVTGVHKQPWNPRQVAELGLLLAVILLVYLFMSSRSTLWDRDEPRFARATVEMLQSSNWLYPTFNDELRPHKPILIYWLMALPIHLFGVSAFAARLWAALGTTATCGLTYLIGRYLFDHRSALRAGAILASSLMIMVIGTMATADAVLLPGMLASLTVFIHGCLHRFRWLHGLLMGLALGWALLAKGPVGLLPVLIMIIFLIWQRWKKQPIPHAARHIVLAVLISIIIFIAWAIPANHATDGEFYRRGIGHHVVHRTLEPMESHGGNMLLFLPYYPVVMLIGFFPWTLHLPGAISAMHRGTTAGTFGRRLFWSWILPVVILMTLVATKLPHYIILCWPMLAVATAGCLWAAQNNTLTDKDRRWLHRGGWFLTPILVTTVAGCAASGWVLPAHSLRLWGPVCALIFAVMGVLALRAHLRHRPLTSARLMLTGLMIFLLPFLFGMIPPIESLKIAPRLAPHIENHPGQVAQFKCGEPSYNFYIGRHIASLDTPQAVRQWARQDAHGILIIPERKLNLLLDAYDDISLQKIVAVSGLDYTKGLKSITIVALSRTPRPDE